MALPLLLYFGGAARVYVVEPELDAAAADWRMRWGLQEIVLRAMTGDVRSRHFVRNPLDVDAFVDVHGLSSAATFVPPFGAWRPSCWAAISRIARCLRV